MDLDKHRVYHRARGSRVLDDQRMELAAYLLSDPKTENDTGAIGGISPEELEQYQSDELFRRRLEYLKQHRPKRPRAPKTQAGYFQYALKGLWRLSRTASADKDKINAFKALAEVAGKAPEEKQQAPEGAVDKLAGLMGAK